MSSAQLHAFAEEARRFCRWAIGDDGARINAGSALRRVSTLYSAALGLPVPFTVGMSAELVESEAPQYALVAARVASLIPLVHWEIFDPLKDPPEDPVAGSIADDLGDIYRDVARGLALFESGEHAEALWQWGFNFRIHWGAHATSAMRALHAYLAQEEPDALSQSGA